MSALLFDPWAALKACNSAQPLPKAPNPANLGTAAAMAAELDGAGLGGLAGLGGGCPATQNFPPPPGPGDAAGLVNEVAALGVRLDARPGGRLWADRPDLLPIALRDSLAAHRPAVVTLLAERPVRPAPVPQPARAWRSCTAPNAPPPAPDLPGVPLEWCEGVALLTARPAPPTVPRRRWAVLAATSARLLRDCGAELHAAGWDALDLFGLHPIAPATNPQGWGLAWLLGASGEILDVSPGVVGMCQGPGGARLAYRRAGVAAQAGAMPAWLL